MAVRQDKTAPLPQKARKLSGRHRAPYTFLKIISFVCAGIAVAALIGIIVFILIRGVPHLSLDFIFGENTAAHPTLVPGLIGTAYLVMIGAGVAIPIGILTAIYLSEYAGKGKVVRIIRLAIETLAAIPSIVYGLFGYIVFVLLFGWGYTLLGGGLTVSIMILPTIIRSVEESLLSVPSIYREGSHALGASKVRTIFSVVLPNAAGGIVTAVILAIGRIISESAVFILTIGMLQNGIPRSPTDPGTSLALNVYYFASDWPELSAATAVVLLVLVVGLNLLATGVGKLIKRDRQ
ncbi:MAG: phosphate ABC transporter permease PstA [Firmicutes bacterium]|nr:phosphate ABC transporter permease PstA [Bacillota bacterium]